MHDFDVKETGNGNYTVTDTSNNEVFEVHESSNGDLTIHKRSGGRIIDLYAIFWVLLVIFMPVIFFVKKIYSLDGAMVPYIAAYLAVLIPFIQLFIPDKTGEKVEKFKKVLKIIATAAIHLLFIFTCIAFFIVGKENFGQYFVLLGPIFGYAVIMYIGKDTTGIAKQMAKLKIKKYSLVGVCLIEAFILVIIVYVILEVWGKQLGDLLAIISCYLYILKADLKLLLIR